MPEETPRLDTLPDGVRRYLRQRFADEACPQEERIERVGHGMHLVPGTSTRPSASLFTLTSLTSASDASSTRGAGFSQRD